jgi:hypothetical protein
MIQRTSFCDEILITDDHTKGHQWIKHKEKWPWKKGCDKRALSAFPGD